MWTFAAADQIRYHIEMIVCKSFYVALCGGGTAHYQLYLWHVTSHL